MPQQNSAETATLIIWDYNGTLINDGEIWAEASQNFYRALRLNFSKKQIREAYDTPISKMIKRLTGKLPEDFNAALFQEAKDAFRRTIDHYTPFVQPREGIPELLKAFSKAGFHQIIVSNHQQDLLVDEISSARLESHFDLISGRQDEDEIFEKTTKADRIISSIEKLEHLMKQKFSHNFLIGDSPEEARIRDEVKKSGISIRSIGFNGGFSTSEIMDKAGHDHIVNDTDEIMQAVLSVSP